MCSFLFSTKHNGENVDDLNRYLRYRGPDNTNTMAMGGSLFIHNLLSITGKFRPQPLVDREAGITLVYNGEIYNYHDFGDYESDGCCLIPLYKKHGADFVKMLDGEFALCLVDTEKGIAVISSDVFKTKPLFLSINGPDIGCASYRTPLDLLGHTNIQKAKPNTTYVISLETGAVEERPVYTFDLAQHKTTYDDWVAAFRAAIAKRVKNTDKNFFIGLSGGYDSGIIYAELLACGITFRAFTMLGSENPKVLEGRFGMHAGRALISTFEKNAGDYDLSHKVISERTEPFHYTVCSSSSDYNEYATLLVDDAGANNFATICRMAKNYDCKICLSGSGADEILADYGFAGRKIYQHSNFGGLFPEDLAPMFPWASFYGSTMESYIAKEEYVGGCFGIEMRYPFLDRAVVQEFLWLSAALKNAQYKAPIDYYFNKHGVPYSKLEKRGFC